MAPGAPAPIFRRGVETPFTRGQAQGISVERSRVNDLAGEMIFSKNCLRPASAANGTPPPDCLAENRLVGRHPIITLGARGAEAQAGDRFIRNHDDAVLVTQLPNQRQHPFGRLHAAGIAEHRLENNRREIIRCFSTAWRKSSGLFQGTTTKRSQTSFNDSPAWVQTRRVLLGAPAVRGIRKNRRAPRRPSRGNVPRNEARAAVLCGPAPDAGRR